MPSARSKILRLAAHLPQGDPTRRRLLATLVPSEEQVEAAEAVLQDVARAQKR